MKCKLRMLSVILIFCMLPVSAFAEDENGFEFDFGAKMVVFFYNEAEGVDTTFGKGWTLAGEVIFWLPKGFGIGVDVEYFTMDEDTPTPYGFDMTVTYTMIPFNINGYYRLKKMGSFEPYFGGGISFVRTEVSTALTVAGTEINMNLDAMDTGANIFAGFKYSIFTIEAQYLFVDSSIDLASLGANEQHSDSSGLTVWAGIRF